MNIVDSSGWLEYLADSSRAKNFQHAIQNTSKLIVPTIVLYEVFKKVCLEHDETTALYIVGQMQQGRVVDLDRTLALAASAYSIEHQLPMADSIIFATAQAYNATIWTQDSDFRDLPGVKYFPKRN